MKTARLILIVLAIIAGQAQAEEFVIGAHLDPYCLHGSTTVSPYIQEYFDSLKAFGANRVIGWGV